MAYGGLMYKKLKNKFVSKLRKPYQKDHDMILLNGHEQQLYLQMMLQ